MEDADRPRVLRRAAFQRTQTSVLARRVPPRGRDRPSSRSGGRPAGPRPGLGPQVAPGTGDPGERRPGGDTE